MDYFSTPEDRLAIENFKGELTPVIRDLIRRKRLSLGASYQQVGNVLCVSWSTIHKWETGTNKSCHSRHVQLIRGFLKGNYDEQFSNIHPVVNFNNHNNFRCSALSDEIRSLIDIITMFVIFNADNPEGNKKLIDDINELITKNIKIILGQK